MDLNHRSLTTTDLQSVPFGHSGTPPLYDRQSELCRYCWSWRWDSNPQPADYKSAALPVELRRRQLGLYTAAFPFASKKCHFPEIFFLHFFICLAKSI